MSLNPAVEWIPFATHQVAVAHKKYKEPVHKVNGKLTSTGHNGLDEHALGLPARWQQSRIICVNSVADLFHESIPSSSIVRIFKAMNDAPQHIYQACTRFSDRLLELSPRLPWHPNIWMGVTVESKDYLFRAQHLRQTGARVKFLSLDPLLGPLPDLDLEGIDWVVLGGESGPGARFLDHDWVTDIRDQCARTGVPFFFKGWGGRNRKLTGRMLDGRTWDAMPGDVKAKAEKAPCPLNDSTVSAEALAHKTPDVWIRAARWASAKLRAMGRWLAS